MRATPVLIYLLNIVFFLRTKVTDDLGEPEMIPMMCMRGEFLQAESIPNVQHSITKASFKWNKTLSPICRQSTVLELEITCWVQVPFLLMGPNSCVWPGHFIFLRLIFMNQVGKKGGRSISFNTQQCLLEGYL